ncbi:THO complex subunit 5 like protein [Myotis brandtii]|uniref:THO complex subunit 5 like protein n=1 Tax=Myotis brandtii TaxID=109478 RepID=S7PV81_MYOBR|nr:THO complex subunit 5 like protein [Myotis brandtii]
MQGVPKTCVHTLTADSSVDVSFFSARLRSKHEEIDLVSVEEFYQEAPPDISKAEITMGDPHQQTLARLHWELEQRKRLAEKYRESLSNKEKILKEIEVKKEYLRSLQPLLNSIMQASLPVQEYLSMPFHQAHKQ